MTQLPDDLPFDGWVRYVFDLPPEQWWSRTGSIDSHPWWDEDADRARTLRYLTTLFAEPEFLLRQYSPLQIDNGLNFLVSNSLSGHMFVLSEAALPWPDRRACFDAMVPLYAKLMAPLYGNILGHLNQGSGDPEQPTFSCYMWWDVIPLYGGMDHPDRDRINEAVLDVCEAVLKLKSEACLESALHGLGHWQQYVPERTRQIVRSFLKRADISPELRRYAEQAATGCVL